MGKMNKVLYVVLDILPFAWLMKLLSGRILAGIVHQTLKATIRMMPRPQTAIVTKFCISIM